jgi:hypothetical protein
MPVTEPDDVGAALAKTGSKGKLVGVVGERNESGFALAIRKHLRESTGSAHQSLLYSSTEVRPKSTLNVSKTFLYSTVFRGAMSLSER